MLSVANMIHGVMIALVYYYFNSNRTTVLKEVHVRNKSLTRLLSILILYGVESLIVNSLVSCDPIRTIVKLFEWARS